MGEIVWYLKLKLMWKGEEFCFFGIYKSTDEGMQLLWLILDKQALDLKEDGRENQMF